MAEMELEPGEPAIWTETQKLLERVAAAPDGPERWYGSYVDNLLLEQGIVADEASRGRLIREADSAFRQVAEQQLRRAEGDYGPDPKAGRFPALATLNSPPKAKTESPTIRALFKLWERDHLDNGKAARTVGDFRQKIESLVEYLDHDDAARVTSENIADWCDYLRHEKGPEVIS